MKIKKRLMEDIRKYSSNAIESWLSDNNEPKFRVKQINDYIWKKNISNFIDMNVIPKKLREQLRTDFGLFKLQISDKQKSNDGSVKYGFKLYDGKKIEGVLITNKDRITACVSSQVGCTFECKFCATGKLKKERNLNFYEIYEQVFLLKNEAKKTGNTLSNIVFMGMGEPLMNYENVMESIARISSKEGLAMSSSRITVSTVGIAKQIRRLAHNNMKFGLAISLHSAIEQKRNKIITVKDSITDLKKALMFFSEKTNRRITIEYLMLNNFNDGLEDIKALIEFCKDFPVKINLLEYNKIKNTKFEPSRPETVEYFKNKLEQRKLIVTIRKSKGKDIDGACGQLANTNTD